MITGCGRRFGEGGRMAAVALLALFLSGLALAGQAGSSPAGTGVRPHNNITVFHHSDFVGVFGHSVGETLTVDLYRGPHRIATSFGPAESTPEGVGLEVNHGPAGAARQGDCWEGHTPDILPGDRVVVTDAAGGRDEAFVDDIAVTSGIREDLSTESPWDIVLKGRAAFADGTPIPVEQLEGEMRQDTPRYEAATTSITRDPELEDGWVARYEYPYKVLKNKGSLDLAEQMQAILGGDHSIGYGHALPPPPEPRPPETQIVEFSANGPAAGGPALGCEGLAPKGQANAVAMSDDRTVNLKSGSLELSGTASPDVTSVRVTLGDGGPDTPDVTVDATGLTGGTGERAWSALFSRAQLLGLTDGMLTATGSYALADGSTVSGASKTIKKDLVKPKITSSLPTRPIYDGRQLVALSSDGRERVRYTTDGSLPNAGSKPYIGDPIPVGRTQTIRAFATDAAGNRGDAAFRYTIRQDTSLVLKARTSRIKPGGSSWLSGKLTSMGQGVAGKRVVLMHKPAGATKFTPRTALMTKSAGTFGLAVRPRVTTVYLARFEGGGGELRSSVSASVRVKVVR